MLRGLCLSVFLGLSVLLWWATEFTSGELAWSLRGQSQAPTSAATPGPSQASPASTQPDESIAARDLLGEAKKCYRKGHFDDAIQKYQRTLQDRQNHRTLTPASPVCT